jgi:hypothetical protein
MSGGEGKAQTDLADIADPKIRSVLKSLSQTIIQQAVGSSKRCAEVIKLPLWPEPKRGAPNDVLRSALFAAIQGKTRRYLDRELLAVHDGVKIKFTGKQLDQADLDVWEQAVHLARQHPLGNVCQFTAHAFLKALGRSAGKSDYAWLEGAFTRLTACAVEIVHKRETYFGSLIEGGKRDGTTGLYIVRLNPDLIKLYASGFTIVDWEQRQTLRGKPLALWLHGYYASHAKPVPVKMETLHQWSGSRNLQKASFRRQLLKAFSDLCAVGAVDHYKVKEGLVYVERTPTESQKRHLMRPKPSKRHK